MSAAATDMENLSINDDNRFNTLFARVGRDCQLLILSHLNCSDLCRFALPNTKSDAADYVDWGDIATRCKRCDAGAPSSRKPRICNRQLDNASDLGDGVSLRAVSRALLMQVSCTDCFDFCNGCEIVVCNAHSDICKYCELPLCSNCGCDCYDSSDEDDMYIGRRNEEVFDMYIGRRNDEVFDMSDEAASWV
jgi:hypothetical protein